MEEKIFSTSGFDLTQLNSDVIRVFKTSYSEDNNCNLSEIINDEVDFYAHCVTKWGIQLGFGKRLESPWKLAITMCYSVVVAMTLKQKYRITGGFGKLMNNSNM